MTLSFVKHGVDDINDSMSLSESVAIGLNEIEELKRDGRLWASQVAHCPREGAIEATLSATRPFGAASRIYCEIGNTLEDLIIKSWDKRSRLLFAQYRLPTLREFPKLNLGGKPDAIARQNGIIRVVEIKTCGDLPQKPRADQQAQALLYSAFTGFPATMVYLSRGVADWRGSLKIKQFDFPFDVDMLSHYMFNAVLARLCIENGVIPSKSSRITKKSHCLYCSFTRFCWSKDGVAPQNSVDGSSLVIPSVKMLLHLSSLALSATEEIMDSNNVLARTNGILKHLSRHGTKAAKELLSGKPWPRNA